MGAGRFLFLGTALLGLLFISQQVSAAYVFSAPPRETEAEAQKVYGPVADWFGKVLGTEVKYEYPGNWGVYQAFMQEDRYDLVFDGPHFVAWRQARLGHKTLARLNGDLTFVGIVKRDDKIKKLESLRGRRVCGLAPPNLATLTLTSQFAAARQPYIIKTSSFRESYEKLMSDGCRLAMLRDKMLPRFDKDRHTRVLFNSKPLPNQAFTAGKRVKPADIDTLRKALTSDGADQPMAAFLKRFNGGKPLSTANSDSYAGLEALLKDVWGFSQ